MRSLVGSPAEVIDDRAFGGTVEMIRNRPGNGLEILTLYANHVFVHAHEKRACLLA